MKTLFVRTLTDIEKTRVMDAIDKTVVFLRNELKLSKLECYCTVQTLFEEFPTEDLDKDWLDRNKPMGKK